MSSKATRRHFLKSAAVASLAVPSHAQRSITGGVPAAPPSHDTDILRRPDRVMALFADGSARAMQFGGGAWTTSGYRVTTEPVRTASVPAMPVQLEASASGLVRLRLRWSGANDESSLCLGDQWERSYGDLEWRGMQPERVMPWYCMVHSAAGITGYGVRTGAAAFCFWQRDASGVTLSIDLRNGGGAADLQGRSFTLCTVVQRTAPREVPLHAAMRSFCGDMCPAPKLPPSPIFGVNDWNYAYGKNTAEGILRGADLIASLAPAGAARPQIVIDDGWQDPQRFPSMPALASQISTRRLQPGLWIRPMRAPAAERPELLLPAARFGTHAGDAAPAYDPTRPDAMKLVVRSITEPVAWGYTFLKHDFSTWEIFGRWGFQMGDQISAPGWNFHDRKLTNAEVITALYRRIRQAAGEGTTILGCNTVGHLAAGIFESQRTGDDTSGRDWERTRRMGVNTLAHRIAQHGTFFHVDPDIVAITHDVGWPETRAWMDVVARTGTSLFLSPDPVAVTPEAKAAMKDAMALVVQQAGAYPDQPTQSTTPQVWKAGRTGEQTRRYDWTPDGAASATTV